MPTCLTWRVLLAVYELFVSVVERRENYTYDLYTALGDREKKFAVGITQGVVWIDNGESESKSRREQHFPLELFDRGVSF